MLRQKSNVNSMHVKITEFIYMMFQEGHLPYTLSYAGMPRWVWSRINRLRTDTCQITSLSCQTVVYRGRRGSSLGWRRATLPRLPYCSPQCLGLPWWLGTAFSLLVSQVYTFTFHLLIPVLQLVMLELSSMHVVLIIIGVLPLYIYIYIHIC